MCFYFVINKKAENLKVGNQFLFSCSVKYNSATAACQASISFTISWSLLKLMFIVLAMPSNISFSVEPFFSCPQSFPVSESFPMSWLVTSGGQNIGASVSTSVLPEYSGLISFKIFWFDLLAVQGTLQSLLQHHNSKSLILQH